MSATAYQREPLALATGNAHEVRLPPRVVRGRLTGFLFETNKTFLLPKGLVGVRGLVDFYAAHAGAGVVVTGHTDTVGPGAANLRLSEERAHAVAAFLRDDVDAWLRHYSGTPGSSRWGTREDQHMLSALPAAATPYYAGPVTGFADAATVEAIRRFQRDHGLVDDGVAGPITRRALCAEYMATDGTSLPAGTDLREHGCGEHHPAVPTPDETDEQGNRRVEVFFFEGPIAPPPRAPCPSPGCPEYPEWIRRAAITIDFEHELTDVLVEVRGTVDGVTGPLAEAEVVLSREGATVRTLHSDGDGRAWFRELTAGRYAVRGHKPDYQTDVAEVVVPMTDDVERGPAITRASFAEGPSNGAGGGGGGQAVVLNLKSDVFKARWVDEDGLVVDAKEEHNKWRHARLMARGNVGGGTQVVKDGDGDGVFLLARPGASKAFVEGAELFGIHETVAKLRLREGPDVELKPGVTRDVRVSSRLRLSVWAFYAPFTKRLRGADDMVLDESLIDAFRDAQIDDLSLVSTIGWRMRDPAYDDDPQVDWRDFAPAGEIRKDGSTYNPKRAANYLRQLVKLMHARQRQVQVGWASVDVKKGSSPYNLAWTAFLKRATTAQIDRLATRTVEFFLDQDIDIDGIGFDFEINSLGSAQGANLARLYQTTAKVMRTKKREGFVSYANAPFAKDGDHTYAFMQVQPFGLARDTPNLLARPMCFDDTKSVPTATITAALACAIRDAASNQGGGLHPGHAQFGLWATALAKSGDWDAMIDACRKSRIGIILYQLPKVGGGTALRDFFAKAATWNQRLNPGEAKAGDNGSPLQVPRMHVDWL